MRCPLDDRPTGAEACGPLRPVIVPLSTRRKLPEHAELRTFADPGYAGEQFE